MGLVAGLAFGGLAVVLASCLPVAPPARVPESEPAPATKVIETPIAQPTATPPIFETPQVTPTPHILAPLIVPIPVITYTSPDVKNNTRLVNFSFNELGSYELVEAFVTATTSSQLISGETALSPGDYQLNFVFTGDDETREVSKKVIIDELTAREFDNAVKDARETFQNKIDPLFLDPAQARILAQEINAFAKGTKLFRRNEDNSFSQDYFNFLDNLDNYIESSGMQQGYSLEKAVEEVKRTLVAANTLARFPHAFAPDKETLFSVLEMYKEHREDNVDEQTSIAFSDPTSFNSVFDIGIVLNFLQEQKEKATDDYRLIQEDKDARTVVLSRADQLGFLLFPNLALATTAPWVEAAGLTSNEAGVRPAPYTTTGAADPRFILWPVFGEQNNPEIRASQWGLATGDLELYYSLGAERWQHLTQMDIKPTTGATILEALAKGNLNETDVRYAFNPLTLISGIADNVTRETHNLSDVASQAITSLLPHRAILADFDVRTRGFIGEHGTLYGSIRTGVEKAASLNSFLQPVNSDAGAFRGFGLVNIFASATDSVDYPLIVYPGREGESIEKEKVLLQAGGELWRAALNGDTVREAQYDPESFGVLCVAPGTVDYPNSIIGNNAVYRNGECVAAGETWAVPIGITLPDVLPRGGLERTTHRFGGSTSEFSPFPNSANAPRPYYPFVNGAESSRRLLAGFATNNSFPSNQERGRGIYGANPFFFAKYFQFNPALFDEARQLPEVEKGSDAWNRGPYRLVVDTVSPIIVNSDYTVSLNKE